MATSEDKTSRPKKPNQGNNWTQCDRELIAAARDKKVVLIYFNHESLMGSTADLVCKVEAVDKYFLKVNDPELHDTPVWIQKANIYAVRIGT